MRQCVRHFQPFQRTRQIVAIFCDLGQYHQSLCCIAFPVGLATECVDIRRQIFFSISKFIGLYRQQTERKQGRLIVFFLLNQNLEFFFRFSGFRLLVEHPRISKTHFSRFGIFLQEFAQHAGRFGLILDNLREYQCSDFGLRKFRNCFACFAQSAGAIARHHQKLSNRQTRIDRLAIRLQQFTQQSCSFRLVGHARKIALHGPDYCGQLVRFAGSQLLRQQLLGFIQTVVVELKAQ